MNQPENTRLHQTKTQTMSHQRKRHHYVLLDMGKRLTKRQLSVKCANTGSTTHVKILVNQRSKISRRGLLTHASHVGSLKKQLSHHQRPTRRLGNYQKIRKHHPPINPGLPDSTPHRLPLQPPTTGALAPPHAGSSTARPKTHGPSNQNF